MLVIYVQLRYHRQLNIIDPESVASFFGAVSDSVSRNGGVEQPVSGGNVYRFSQDSVGYVFAAARVIADIAVALARHKDRIREYVALVDSASPGKSTDFAAEFAESYQHIPLPDEGILLTASALAQLDAYVAHAPEEATPFHSYQGSRLEGRQPPETDQDQASIDLYTEGGIDPVLSLVDALERLGLSPGVGQDASAVAMYRSLRYEYDKPEYLRVACGAWIDSALNTPPGQSYPIRVLGSADSRNTEKYVRDRVREGNRVIQDPSFAFSECDLVSIPKDLLDLAYLSFRSSRYLCGDELIRFFSSLDRNEDFLFALGRWLWSFSLLARADDFRSLNFAVFGKIRDMLALRCAELDLLIADFIWKEYEDGALQPAFSLLDALSELGFTIPDRFLVACLYHGGDPRSEIERLSSLFSSAQLTDAVRTLERARALYAEGASGEALLLARDVLHRFQKTKILAGEYHALRLISDITFQKGKGDEAVTYLEYALENAERLHDSAFILSTRFDIAMLYFVNGDLSSARSILAALDKLIAVNLAKDMELLSVFMNGRISFELGEYAEASAFFQKAAASAGSDGLSEAIPLCKVWYARSIAHQHRYLQAMEMLSSCVSAVIDAWPFLLEAAILAGKPVTCHTVPDSIDSLVPPANKRGPFDWSSGFLLAEDRLGPSKESERTPRRMFNAFKRYYRAGIDRDGALGSEASGLIELAREAGESADPSAGVYYYLCYLLGNGQGEKEGSERLSCLSRGFKFLQLRCGAIGNVSLREAFLQNPTWNNRLYRAARENKLI